MEESEELGVNDEQENCSHGHHGGWPVPQFDSKNYAKGKNSEINNDALVLEDKAHGTSVNKDFPKKWNRKVLSDLV